MRSKTDRVDQLIVLTMVNTDTDKKKIYMMINILHSSFPRKPMKYIKIYYQFKINKICLNLCSSLIHF
jgi:hypothetical protein